MLARRDLPVEQQFDAVSRGEFALGVLGGDALLSTPEARTGTTAIEAGEHVFHRSLQLAQFRA